MRDWLDDEAEIVAQEATKPTRLAIPAIKARLQIIHQRGVVDGIGLAQETVGRALREVKP